MNSHQPMTSTWRPLPTAPASTASSLYGTAPFDSLPYPYSPSSNSFVVPQPPSQHPGGIRRAKSSGTLESEASRRPTFQASWARDAAAAPGGPSTTRRHDFDPSPVSSRRPSSTAMYPLLDYPSQVVPDNPRRFHRRTSSAQPAFFASSAASSALPHPFVPMDSIASASSQSSSRSESFSGPTSSRMQGQPSVEEVDLFLSEMHQMLGPDALPSLGPSAPVSHSNGLALTSTCSPPASASGPNRQTYNVSGVLLSEEEYRQFSRSEDQSAESRSHCRPRNCSDSAARYIPDTSRFQYAPQPSPGYDIHRPRSAPPSPQVDFGSDGQFVPFYSPQSPPHHRSEFQYHTSPSGPFVPNGYSSGGASSLNYNARPFRRRGSSVDATIPRTFVSTLSTPASYGYASYPTATPPPPSSTASSGRSNQPVGYPPPPCFPLPTPPPSHPRQLAYDDRQDEHSRGFYPSACPPPPPPPSRSYSRPIMNYDDDAPISPISPVRGGRGEHEGRYRYRTSSAAIDIDEGPSSPSPACAPAPFASGRQKPGTTRAGGVKAKVKATGSGSSGSISFINFSASDSKALLSGVAPSGSSKKRQRTTAPASGEDGCGVQGEHEVEVEVEAGQGDPKAKRLRK